MICITNGDVSPVPPSTRGAKKCTVLSKSQKAIYDAEAFELQKNCTKQQL